MKDLTLIIPAKNEKDSLPRVLNELKEYNLKIIIVLEKEDLDTINAIKEHDCNVYLVNTGWVGGGHGVGERISIKNTRNCIAILARPLMA